MGNKQSLMTPAEVAKEVVEDIEDEYPSILQSLNSKESNEQQFRGKEIESRLTYQIQDAKIATYNMHMNLQGYSFPLDGASDFSDNEKFQQLLDWLDKHYPE